MESGIQSSFIPQDAARPTPSARPVRGGGLSELGFLIGIVLFVASAALAGAVFLYEQYTISSASSKSEQLRRAKEAFEPALIHELTRLDDRMRAADQVLAAHMAPLSLFDALQATTLSTVSFKTLSLEVVDSQNVNIKMSGVAQGVNSIALQADIFSKSGIVTNPIFSDINRQADGVHFNLNALVNPAAINYGRLINTAGAAVSVPTQQTPTSPFAPQNTVPDATSPQSGTTQ
jgi:hypothetical protein